MIIKSLKEHISTDVHAVAFYELSDPLNLSVTNFIGSGHEFLHAVKLNYDDTSQVIHYDQNLLQFKIIRRDDSDPPIPISDHNWNVILYLAQLPDDVTYISDPNLVLSYSAWDNVITEQDNFYELKIDYSAIKDLSTSDTNVTIDIFYILHNLEESTYSSLSNALTTWAVHKNLDLKITTNNTEKVYSKVEWVRRGITKIVNNTNNKLDSPINGFSDSNEIQNIGSYSVTPSSYIFKSIPDCTNEDSKLITCNKFGIGFYNPLNGEFTGQSNYVFATPPNDEELSGLDYEVYFYGKTVTIFYYPDLYRVYVSCVSDYSTNPVWETPWIVGGENSDIKILIPSYFDIFKFAFIYTNETWKIIYVSSFKNDSSILNDNLLGNTDLKFEYSNYLSQGSVPVEIFFRDSTFISYYMYNEFIGMEQDYKQKVRSYILSQLYISYHTLLQALRFNSDNENVKIKDTGIIFGNNFIPYSQDFSVSDYKDIQKSTSISMSIKNLLDLDNFIALTENSGDPDYLYSLVDGSSKLVSSYSKVQMKHGIVVGFDETEGKYVQLL